MFLWIFNRAGDIIEIEIDFLFVSDTERRITMKKNIVLLDGAVGTSFWEKTDDRGPVWKYNVENPRIVLELHKEMAEAGACYVLANTFSANRPSVEKLGYTVDGIVTPAMELAHEALDGNSKIVLSIGPLTGMLEPFGDIKEEEAYELFDEQISVGVKGKPDLIYLQTFMDLKMMCIAAKAASKHALPLFCSMSFATISPKKGARTIMGDSVDKIVKELQQFEPMAIGLNCSMGPDEALPVIKEFSEKTDIPLIFKPNAGKPKFEGGSEFDKDVFAEDVAKAAEYKGVKYLGGCCGSNAQYIRALRDKLAGM